MTQGDVLLHFPHLDPLLVQYADTNVYAMLTTYTLGEARSLVRQARRPNGFEAFRLLQIRFNPVTIGRQRADLMKITNPAAAISIDKLAAELVNWENLIVQYESRPGADRVSDAMKMAALVHMVPNALKQHLHMNAARYTTYLELREEVMSYVEQVAPVASTTMDVGSVGVSKGGGCYICGGPHMQKDCKKGKGKGGKDGGKGKGKIPDGGKGKGKGKGFEGKKGGGKAKPVCHNCGKTGHYKDQCWSRPKPLNTVEKETSPLLSQLQSSYAKAAVEEFQRLRSTGASSSSAPSPPVVQISTPSSPTSPGAASSALPKPPVSTGSLTIKHLCALSRAQAIARRIVADAEQGRFDEMERRIEQYLQGACPLTVTVDSGAAASVAPAEAFAEHEQLAPVDGVSFLSANGEIVPELYRVKPLIVTEEGKVRGTEFSIAQVHKVLMSAAQVANRGHRILLAPYWEDSWIEEIETGERMQLHQEEGVYVQRMHVVHPSREGFSGPAPWIVPPAI